MMQFEDLKFEKIKLNMYVRKDEGVSCEIVKIGRKYIVRTERAHGVTYNVFRSKENTLWFVGEVFGYWYQDKDGILHFLKVVGEE